MRKNHIPNPIVGAKKGAAAKSGSRHMRRAMEAKLRKEGKIK